jgi:prepilin-type N-terminal cleavage/methylation domain-containing protein/prepilin-type processing-associated H-X9-DG protein
MNRNSKTASGTATGPKIRSALKLSHSGFTIIELLVCIAVIGVLTALLLPAVQMARESARRVQCKKNLKDLAIAAHNFESTHRYLPAGIDFQLVGPVVYLLPYLDQVAYYEGFSFDDRFTYWWQNPKNRPPVSGSPWEIVDVPRPPTRYGAEGTLPILLCPSAPAADQVGDVIMCVTHGTPGVDFTAGIPTDWYLYSSAPGSQVLTRNYYASCAGDYYYENGKYRGVFTYSPRGRGTRIGQISDGTSNTLLFGETAGNLITWDTGLTPQLNTQTVAGSSLYITDGIDNNTDYLNTNSDAVHFGSRHNGIIHFAFADGSVRAIQNSGSLNEGPMFLLMLRLGGMHDGEVVSAP